MEPIRDCSYYVDEMRKSSLDKLFFEKLAEEKKIDSVVDFGCADGFLLRLVNKDYPELNLLGIDDNPRMLEKFAENCPTADYFLGDHLPETLRNKDLSRTCLVLSSVIHEIYSYKSPEEVKRFWNDVFGFGFGYIAIRDMMVDKKSKDLPPLSEELFRIKRDSKYGEFALVWGEVRTQRDLVHFLLKSQYENSPNWERELREDYLPIAYEELIDLIPKDRYSVTSDHYIYYYTDNVIRNKFGIKLGNCTHAKFLLKKIR